MDITKERNAANIMKRANLALLLIHCVLLLMFHLLEAYIMVFINLGSILVYFYNFALINKGHLDYFTTVTYLEIWVHMVAATYIMGWEFGFQLYCIPLPLAISFTEYSLNSEKKKFKLLLFSIATGVIFLTTRIITFYQEPVYNSISKHTALHLYIVNSLIVFGFLTAFVVRYTRAVLYFENSLRRKADYDELTEIYNRHRIQYLLDQLYENAVTKNENFCIAILDIDDFKKVNDMYGHNTGDYVLQRVAAMIHRRCSSSMMVGRWGGEEFLIVQTYNEDLDECIENLNSIRAQVSNMVFFHEKKEFNITATIGISAYKKGMSISEVIGYADAQLYSGKKNGKNCVEFAQTK